MSFLSSSVQFCYWSPVGGFLGTSYTAGKSVNCYNHLEKNLATWHRVEDAHTLSPSTLTARNTPKKTPDPGAGALGVHTHAQNCIAEERCKLETTLTSLFLLEGPHPAWKESGYLTSSLFSDLRM